MHFLPSAWPTTPLLAPPPPLPPRLARLRRPPRLPSAAAAPPRPPSQPRRAAAACPAPRPLRTPLPQKRRRSRGQAAQFGLSPLAQQTGPPALRRPPLLLLLSAAASRTHLPLLRLPPRRCWRPGRQRAPRRATPARAAAPASPRTPPAFPRQPPTLVRLPRRPPRSCWRRSSGEQPPVLGCLPAPEVRHGAPQRPFRSRSAGKSAGPRHSQGPRRPPSCKRKQERRDGEQ